MFINLLLVLLSLCLASAVSLNSRDIPLTTDTSAIIGTLKFQYAEITYSGGCLANDCQEVQSSVQYCSSTCDSDATGTSTLLNSLQQCITKPSCSVPFTNDLDPFNISFNSGSCYLSAGAPKLQLVPKGSVVQSNNQYDYTVDDKMDFVWSGLNLQCDNLPSASGPPSTTTTTTPTSTTSSCYQDLTKYFSFLCPIKNLLPYLGFYFLFWLPCPSNSTSNPTPSPTVNSFSGPLQFTQSATFTRVYKFPPPSTGGSLKVDTTTEAPDQPDIICSFVFDAGVPVAYQPAIQAGIENVLNDANQQFDLLLVVKFVYKYLVTAYVSGFCGSLGDSICRGA